MLLAFSVNFNLTHFKINVYDNQKKQNERARTYLLHFSSNLTFTFPKSVLI